MNTLPFQADIAARMQADTDETIHPQAVFYQTANGYWLAWHNGIAAVLAPDTPPDIPCDWVEGAHDLAEIVALVESGEYAEVEEFDGDDEAWQAAIDAQQHHH
ncbi:general secretion pathway protein GspG [Paralysiella testudinis]|uniref:General secretion pathway protein GspG n=1 Tax=Paralysiella testudinis TaxID=2809020 RepID=A0A892ZE79_9NEIS|nr:general secretion pathway protein GspG [Paralysiella testudinis]QRQ81242.1 general secretion pathway protein GspG [Paralysiella testudinis]